MLAREAGDDSDTELVETVRRTEKCLEDALQLPRRVIPAGFGGRAGKTVVRF